MTAAIGSRQRGFTVIEMVVTLFVLVMVILGVLQLFDLAAKVSRVQVDTADMQQVLRTAQYDMVRMLRMAGRGKVPPQSPPPPVGPWTRAMPNGVAVAVTDNVPANTYIDDPTSNAHPVLRDTDVLTIRGVLTSPVYLANSPSFSIDSTNPLDANNGGTFTIPNTTPQGGLPQSLDRIAQAIDNHRPEALVLVSPDDDSIRQIVMLDFNGSSVTRVGAVVTQVLVHYRIGGSAYATAYWALSGSQWNAALTKLGYVGVVEEYRYYVSDEREDPADPTSAPKPRLLRARLYPGTAEPWGEGPGAVNDDANWGVPMADNVADLQVALGIETGVGDAFTITDAGDANDEWLFNSTADDATLAAWRTGRLRYVRVNTTVFAERRDRTYQAPTPAVAEDHAYVIPAFGTPSQNVPDRMYRRRTLKTVVDLRNM
jgi:type II secretory pathway pseudopilin PulG